MVIYMKKNAFIFVSISFLCVTFFTLLPLLYSFGMTFFSGRGNELVFSGFDDYTRIWEDKTFIKALQNTLFFAILIPPLVLVTSVYLANLINKITNRRFRSFITTVIYLPSIVSPVAYSFFFRRFFAVDGFLNTLLMYLGLLKEQQNFLLTPTGARIAIIMICLWAWTGYYTVLILSSYQHINPLLYKSGQLDGANSVQTFMYITLPTIKPVVLFSSILLFGGIFQLISEIMIVSKGGPEESTLTLAYYVYRLSFEYAPQFGYATTISLIILFFSLVTTIIQYLMRGKQ